MRGKRILFAAILLIACSFTVGMALAKEDYDFDVESRSVDASVWGRVSYTNNDSILPVVKDVINYNIHLIGKDRNLITVNNKASLTMVVYKGKSVYKEKTVHVYDDVLSITTGEPWEFSNNATKVEVSVYIDGVRVDKTLRD